MSNTKNNGGPAFPRQHDWGYGMTLRDYFAAMAIQGIVAGKVSYEGMAGFSDSDAEQCYIIADAMLKAREQ